MTYSGLSCSRVRYPTLNDVVECDLAESGYQVLTKPGSKSTKSFNCTRPC